MGLPVTRVSQVDVYARCSALVGESPVFDPRVGRLLWLDIEGRRLYRSDAKEVQSRALDEPTGCVALTEADSNRLVLAAGTTVYELNDWNGSLRWLSEVDEETGMRFNDGKCDRRGRLYVGVTNAEAGRTGRLYGFGENSHRPVISEVKMSNGLDWTADESSMLYVDSLAGTITRYRWDPESGTPHSSAVFATWDLSKGLLDGLAVDEEGGVWVAVWGGGCVLRFDGSGRLVRAIELPASQVTSCTFGGEDRSTLFVTTAATGLTGREVRATGAGDVFAVATDAVGQPARYVSPGTFGLMTRSRPGGSYEPGAGYGADRPAIGAGHPNGRHGSAQ
jgi:sugar lactone lactonase YvrE